MYKIVYILILILVIIFWHYEILRYIKINISPLSNVKKYCTVPRVKVKTKVIICFTTTPKRLDRCQYTIESLLLQTVRVDEIRIHVGNYKLPIWLRILERQLPEFRIIRCDKDWGPATKLIPALLDKTLTDDTRIIYLDDDMIYNKRTIETLISYSIIYPNHAICNKGWNVDKYPETLTNLCFNFIKGIITPIESVVDVIQGFSGVLVRPSFFDSEITKCHKYPEEAFYVDDVYISGILNQRNIGRISTGIPSCIPYIKEILNEIILTPTSLATIHNKDKKNDCIVANFFNWTKQVVL